MDSMNAPVKRRNAAELAAMTLVAAQAAWIAAGFVFPSLPGWTMFARVERVRATLVDNARREADLYDFVPRDVYVIDASGARAIAAFVCRARPERAPWVLRWDDGREEDACPP